MLDARFAAFVLVAALLIGTPGPDTALTVRNAIRGGVRSAFATAWGVGAGSAVWAFGSVLGIGALLAASETAFTVFKVVGAAYLVYLGIRSLREAGRKGAQEPVPTAGTRDDHPLLQGLFNNLLNPKAAAIFLTAFPQFIQPGDSLFRLLAMLAVYEVMVVGWLHVVGLIVSRVGRLVGASALWKRLNAVAGVVLIGLGVHLAFERR